MQQPLLVCELLIRAFLGFGQELNLLLAVEIGEAEGDRPVYLFFKLLVDALDFLLPPVGDGEAHVVSVDGFAVGPG